MPAIYSHAPEVKAIALDLIDTVEDHADLADVTMLYVWRDKASKSGGRVVLGRARRLSGLNAFLATGSNEPLFVIEVARDTWQALEEFQQRALVDHELCHCGVEWHQGERKLVMRPHDVEEFGGIVERHGLWKSDVARFGSRVAGQLSLAITQTVDFVRDIGDADQDGGDDA